MRGLALLSFIVTQSQTFLPHLQKELEHVTGCKEGSAEPSVTEAGSLDLAMSPWTSHLGFVEWKVGPVKDLGCAHVCACPIGGCWVTRGEPGSESWPHN